MENINFIFGKTPDGRNVTLDGFRVESYSTYLNDKGEGCVDIYFKSGQEVTLLAEDEDGEFIPIPAQLDACWIADPEIVTALHPRFDVMCRKLDNGSAFKFDPNSIEFYMTGADADEDDEADRDVELHFTSGRAVTVRRDPEMDDLDGESLEIVIDDCICRYFKDEEDQEDDDDDECDDACHRKHVFLTKVFATVGQIRKDLEEIVKHVPASYLSYRDEVGNDCYISGIKEWKDLILLKTTVDEEDAIAVHDLLNAWLEDLSDDTEVLLQNGWELRNLRPNLESGKFFWYDEDFGCNCFEIVPCDIRLISADELMFEAEDLVEEDPEKRLVCLGEDGKVYRVIELFDNDGMNYIRITDGEKGKDVHVSDLEGCFFFENGGVVVVRNQKGTITYNAISEVESSPDSLPVIFFSDEIGDEEVVAIRLGSVVYSNDEDDIDDDELFSDDDVIIRPNR